MKPLSVAMTALLAAGAATSLSAKGTQPSFDCQKAASEAEELICADDKLSALDRRLADTYAQAVRALEDIETGSKETLDTLRATQRGWIKGRDECWKSQDLRACVMASYLSREGELVASWMLQEPASVATFACDGNRANEVTAFFFDTEQPSVRLEYGDSIDTGSQARTASGSRYDASFGRFLWIKGDEAIFVWEEGTEMSCTLQD